MGSSASQPSLYARQQASIRLCREAFGTVFDFSPQPLQQDVVVAALFAFPFGNNWSCFSREKAALPDAKLLHQSMCRATQVASLLGTDSAGLLKNIRDLFKVEDAVEAQPMLCQPIFGAGILTTAMVEKDHDVLHL
jgi:hypothetical protein